MSADVPSGCPRHFPIRFLQGLGSGLPSLQLGEQAKVLCRNLHPHSMSRPKDALSLPVSEKADPAADTIYYEH